MPAPSLTPSLILSPAVATMMRYHWQDPDKKPWIRLAGKLLRAGRVFFGLFDDLQFGVRQSFWHHFLSKNQIMTLWRFEFCMDLYVVLGRLDFLEPLLLRKEIRLNLRDVGGSMIWTEEYTHRPSQILTINTVFAAWTRWYLEVFGKDREFIKLHTREKIKCVAYCSIRDRATGHLYSLQGRSLDNQHDKASKIHFQYKFFGATDEKTLHCCSAQIDPNELSHVGADLSLRLGYAGVFCKKRRVLIHRSHWSTCCAPYRTRAPAPNKQNPI